MSAVRPLPGRFDGRTAIITGGGTGMGRAAALRLANEGANVVIAGRRPEELEATASEIRKRRGSVLAVPTDVTDESQIENLLRATLDAFGEVHLAWNNAGVLGSFNPIHETKLEDVDALLAINFRGAYACVKHEVAAM